MIAASLPTPVPPLTAAPLYLRATLRSVVWRSHGRFHLRVNSATLAGCVAHPETARQPHPISLKRCSGDLGRLWADHPSMTFRHGPSATIGPNVFPHRRPRWTYSKHGSATCSTRCSGLAREVRSVQS
jgi:hypothetical protein